MISLDEQKEIAGAIFRLVQSGEADRRKLTNAQIACEVNKCNPNLCENAWRCRRVLKNFNIKVNKRRIDGQEARFVQWEEAKMRKMYSDLFHNGEFPGMFS